MRQTEAFTSPDLPAGIDPILLPFPTYLQAPGQRSIKSIGQPEPISNEAEEIESGRSQSVGVSNGFSQILQVLNQKF